MFMKKKIKDLTIKECEIICNKHKQDCCIYCPLNYDYYCRYGKLRIDEEEKKYNLEREVEVDEINK